MSTQKSTYIFVRFQKEGIHKYPEALSNPKLATGGDDDVSFLGYPHRHMFHFDVRVEVFHNNRDLEFIQEKRYMESLYAQGTLALDYKSCEMMADDLYAILAKRYSDEGRRIVIQVSEDGENGCYIEYPAT
jgi:hypothetical protein